MTQAFRELDVRPLIASSVGPFQHIMAATEALAPGQGLRLLAPFRPDPLFTVMSRKGFEHMVNDLGDGSFEVLFSPVKPALLSSDEVASVDDWAEPVLSLDLSDLDPPQPMIRILAELEGMAVGDVLFVVLAREPVFLFPELVRRGHQWVGNRDKSGETFRMLVRRGESNDDRG
ncbi:DUF2249 domain-containing protein [Rhizobium oryzicola]|uniref:DUF2249 domain-containing protein n=1 Tax=Rhizobium oryzicola TaxID=1232668 RepID=A0ABT8SXX6_9HYPH|nr:DUF2249 domain-containing protein [Rhizobium oryzicola]MDO1582888.1 DUF2249 domain-containing protein [Rhizobium oryzicola]